MLKSIQYIVTIAANERRLLYRKPLFLILGGLGIIGILLFMVVMTIVSIVDDGVPGEFLLTGTDAYLALYFFSFIQAVLIIFVAADFHKAEENSRLDQVMLSKPMTTANWVIGKYFGVVGAVLYLNLFLIMVATVGRTIKALMTGAGFNIIPFLEYFIVATLPAILFMTALIFFLVSLLRASAIAIIVAGAYVAAIWFYLMHKFHGLFDYAAFFAPLFNSDFIGFGDIESVLWQRLFFILLTFSLLGASVLLYPRLSQSKGSMRLSAASTVIFLIAAAFVGILQIQTERTAQTQRQQDFAFQKNYISKPTCKILHYDFDIKIVDETAPLKVSAKMVVSNPHEKSLAQLVFSLNSELSVHELKWPDGTPIEFKQEHQLLILDLKSHPLQPHSVDSLMISYSGTIDADGFMLDRLPESKGIVDKSNGPWTQGNMSAWLDIDFVVLPSQCGWYPIPGAAAGYPFSAPRSKNFATAEIRITAKENLTAVTQGERISETIEDEHKISLFSVKEPVPQFSLHLGPYNRLGKKFGETEIEVYVHEKHLLDYDLFADVADTCYEAVASILDIFENITGIEYPYPKLALVEVPLQMQIYTNRFGQNNILKQPQIIMVDEVTVASQRLKKEIEEETEHAQERGRDDSPARIKREVFIDLVLDIFFNDRFWRGDGSIRSPINNYVNFQIDIQDPRLERALELQFYEECERQLRDLFFPDRWNAALSSFDRMRKNEWGSWTVRRRYGMEIDSLISTFTKIPLADIRPEKNGNLYRAYLDFKAPPILLMLSQGIGEKNYATALKMLIDEFRHQPVQLDDFISILQKNSNEELEPFFKQWFDEATFPGYRITQAKAKKIDTGKMNIVYQITTRVQNGEKGDGFVRVVCNTKNDKIRRSLQLRSYEEKELQFIVREEPKTIEIIPYFSRNRGKILKQVSIDNRIRRATPIDTVFTVTSTSDSLFFVLDDQDDGFFTPTNAETKYLRPPSKGKSWWEDTNPYAFGKYYFGWRVKRAGNGDYPAKWETVVPNDGDYELSFYFRSSRGWFGRNMSRTFKVRVTSADGTYPIEFQPQSTVDGWFPLGRFNFTKEKAAVVELLDEGNGYLIADAIRWEFVE